MREALLGCACACACACAAPPSSHAPIRSGAVAADPPLALTEACVRRFIAAEPLAPPVSAPDLHRVPAHGAGAHYYTFDIEYGAPEGCGDACNPSYANGVALTCDHIGWYHVTDNTDGRPAKPTMFEVRPTDTILFDDRLWPDAVAPELMFWLADDPRVPPAVREKARAHQPEIYF